MTTRAVSAAFLLLVVLLVGCAQREPASPASSADAATPAAQDGSTVLVQNIAFKPASLEVLRGTEVTWASADANVRHTVTSGVPGTRAVAGVSEGAEAKPDGLFDGDLPDAGSEFSLQFDEAGTYAYFCEVHPSMTAEIVVE